MSERDTTSKVALMAFLHSATEALPISGKVVPEQANIDETLMPRHIMVSTIFEKNRLGRLLKPILGKSAPDYLV